MTNRFLKKFVFSGAMVLCAISLSACQPSTKATSNHSKNKNETSSITFNNIETESAEGQYQVEATYPIEVTDDAFDDSLLTNQMTLFKGYSGQGTLLLKSNELDNFAIFINGYNVEIDSPSNSEWNKVDISNATINGDNKLQVSKVNDDANTDATLEVKVPYPTLIDRKDEYKENDNLTFIDQIINSEIDNGFTSAQLVVTKDGEIIKQSSYGKVNSYNQDGSKNKDSNNVTDNTLYDLASNTKMYATNYAVQKLVSEDKLDIDQKVIEIIPEFKDQKNDDIKGKNNLKIKEILQHQAGFPADPQYHNNNYDSQTEELYNKDANKLYTQNREDMLKMVIKTPLEYTPGTETRYSDVDYILLGFIVEEITGQRLDEYVKENYISPLKLTHTLFNPLDNGFKKQDVAANELNGNTRDGVVEFNNIRTNTVQGEVHDEKAFYSMDGVSGHAGLFSNASDLAILTQITLNGGGYGDNKFFDKDTMEEFIKPKDGDPSYGLGWRRKGTNYYSWAFSPIANSSTVGHTGWVGTLTVIDPVNDTSVVLLTNTKNSPVLDNEQDPNDFVGNHYLTGGYGLISTLSFDSTDNSNKTANDSKLVDMISSKYNLIQENEDYQTQPDKASLQALVDVMEDRKKSSSIINNFTETDKWDSIQQFLD